jgi:RimJ/RimL family protein N-acetyltransferase
MLRGDLVTLRPIASSDLPIIRCWFDDPETMRFWAMPRPFVTERQFEADLLGRFASFEEEGYFMIIDPAGEPIGWIDYGAVDQRSRSAELGVLIGEADARGKGYGSDAIRVLLRHLVHDRGLHRVSLTTLAWNERALRTYLSLGFREEGVLRDHRYVDGGYVDEIQMSMLRPEFDLIRSSSDHE